MFKCKICGKEVETGRGLGGHMATHSPDRNFKPGQRVPFEDIKKDGTRKRWLIVERGHRCEVCSLTEWRDKPIPIELDHIDGHPEHNDKSNLRLICPNCHAQTEHWKGRNVGHHSGTKRQEVMKKYPSYRKG